MYFLLAAKRFLVLPVYLLQNCLGDWFKDREGVERDSAEISRGGERKGVCCTDRPTEI